MRKGGWEEGWEGGWEGKWEGRRVGGGGRELETCNDLSTVPDL